jgi:DNA-binding transcriptional ArsR family regulator
MPQPPDALSQTFGALADPTRRAILARLARGEASVSALAQPFEISLPAVSRHLKVLEHAGLIARGREGKWRPCRLEAARIREVAVWAGAYRRFWERSLDKLDSVLDDMRRESDRG